MTTARAEAPAELAAAEAADRRWDVVVAGGGPAGTTLAAHLAAAGHAVLVVERARYPRDKTCGDGLIADALRALDALGLLGEVRRLGHSLRRVSVHSPARTRLDVEGEFVTLRRGRLDALLAGAAAARGARFVIGAVERVTPLGAAGAEGVEVRVRGAAAPVRARYAAIATGADVSLARPHLDVGPSQPSAVAVRRYVTSPVAVDALVVSFDRTILPGYAWIFPMGDGTLNVGCGVFYADGGRPGIDLRAMLDIFLREFPLARAVMARATGVGELEGARLRCAIPGTAARAGCPVVAVGETIGTTFPFTGEGIGKAMESGALAAGALHAALEAGDPAPLAALAGAVERELRPRYRGYVVAQRWLAHPWLGELLARRIARSERLRRRVGGILNETVDPREVFSLRGLLAR